MSNFKILGFVPESQNFNQRLMSISSRAPKILDGYLWVFGTHRLC
jgi:hypothetical protein